MLVGHKLFANWSLVGSQLVANWSPLGREFVTNYSRISLREVVYSRHPDPRRVWKGGSEQHLLTPLPRAPGANAKKLYVAVFYGVFEKCLFLFSVKCYMLLCFTVILLHDLHIIFTLLGLGTWAQKCENNVKDI